MLRHHTLVSASTSLLRASRLGVAVAPTPHIVPTAALQQHQQIRSVGAKSARNKTAKWIGTHKEPLTEESRLRRARKHKPFVLGRDNVKQDYEPVPIPPSCLPTSTNSNTGDHSESSKLGFSVRRTVNGALPVYTDYKNGRSRITTIVRRVDGDITALAGMLSEIFPAAAVDLRRRQEMTAVGAGGVQMHMASGSETTTTMDATDATPTTLLRRPSANALRPRVTLRADLGQVHIRGNVQRTVRHWLTALGF